MVENEILRDDTVICRPLTMILLLMERGTSVFVPFKFEGDIPPLIVASQFMNTFLGTSKTGWVFEFFIYFVSVFNHHETQRGACTHVFLKFYASSNTSRRYYQSYKQSILLELLVILPGRLSLFDLHIWQKSFDCRNAKIAEQFYCTSQSSATELYPFWHDSS